MANLHAAVEAIEYALPAGLETIDDLAESHPHWKPQKLAKRTGIHTRHISQEDETASDLAVKAAEKLFARGQWGPEDFDFLLFCTQTPDYFMPSTACLVQDRLNLPRSAGALDINLGCSGFIYALGLAQGLIASGQAKRIMLVTADTYSKFVNPEDRSVRALFGDAAAVTVVTAKSQGPQIGPFVYGTDGRGAKDLIVPMGGMRNPLWGKKPEEHVDRFGNRRTDRNIYMNGKAIVEFSLEIVPKTVNELCEKAGVSLDDLDAIVPHQASTKVLEGIRKSLDLAPERFISCMRDVGNTVSCSIPIALRIAQDNNLIKPAANIMVVGFGVGLSWGATLLNLPEKL